MGGHQSPPTTETTRRKMRVNCLSLTPLLLLAALSSAAPYEVESSSPAPASSAPEKLVEAARSVHCRVEYATIWDTKYEEQPFEVCETIYQQLCEVKSQRLCQNTTREECFTTYKKVCVDEYKTVLEPYTETECVTTYREDCEYHWEIVGKEKVWAPIQGSCKTNPYDECKDVEKTHSKQVAYPVCHDVPEKKCHYVPDQVCKSVGSHHHQDFFPVPAVPVQGLVPAATLPVQTTLAPVPEDVINRNEEPTFAFANGNSVEGESSNVPEFDKFVFENTGTVNFEE